MKYLQIMPIEETFFDSNFGFITAVSIVLITVIVLFDRFKAFLNKLSKNKTKLFNDRNKPLIERLLPENEYKQV